MFRHGNPFGEAVRGFTPRRAPARSKLSFELSPMGRRRAPRGPDWKGLRSDARKTVLAIGPAYNHFRSIVEPIR